MDRRMMDVVEEYLSFQQLMGHFVSNSAAAVRSDFRGLIRHLSSKGITETLAAFNTRIVGEYLASQRKRVAGATMKRWCKSFSGFARWAVERDYLTKNPMRSLSVGWVAVRRREFMLERTDAARFLNVSVRTRLMPEVEQLLRCLFLFCGLRRSEVLKLQWKHIDLNRDLVLIYDSKNSRRKGHPENFDRAVPICPPLKNALLALHDVAPHEPEEPVVFQHGHKPLAKDALYEFFHAIREAMNLNEEFVPHSLRHSLASNLIAIGATTADVALLLGHASSEPDGRRTVTDGYITSSVGRVRSFLGRYAVLVMELANRPLTPDSVALDHAGTIQNTWGAPSRGALPPEVARPLQAMGFGFASQTAVPLHSPHARDRGGVGPSGMVPGPAAYRGGSGTPVHAQAEGGQNIPPWDPRMARHDSAVPPVASGGPPPGPGAPNLLLLAEAAALWKCLYPNSSLVTEDFLEFVRILAGRMNSPPHL